MCASVPELGVVGVVVEGPAPVGVDVEHDEVEPRDGSPSQQRAGAASPWPGACKIGWRA
jgi:hypothetical protein